MELLGVLPHPHSDWELNPKVECSVMQHKLPSQIMKKEYQGNLEGTNSEEPQLFPVHVNHCLTIQKNIKEEPDGVEEDGEDPLGDSEPDAKWKHSSTFTNVETKSAETDTDGKPFKCESCEKIFNCASEIIKHKTCHQTGDKQHKCETCGKCFAMEWMVKRHMASHIVTKSFQCDVCGMDFSCLMLLDKHRLCHTQPVVKLHECNECQKSFTTRAGLKSHMEYRHIADKLHKCDVCQKEFASIYTLNRHVVCHMKPHKCNECEKSFAHLYGLKSHIESHHTNDKSFKCDVCGKEFPCLAALKAHQKLHTGNNKCSWCERCFTSSWKLNEHMVCHTREKPYVCGICGKSFSLESYLRKHQKLHTKEKPHL